MKKAIFIVIAVIILNHIYSFVKRCGVLPKDTNYELVLSNSLYKFDKNGLVDLGYINNPEWQMRGDLAGSAFSRSEKIMYFYDVKRDIYKNYTIGGIYKNSLYNLNEPILLLNQRRAYILSVSPDDKFLLYSVYGYQQDMYHILWLLNLKVGKQEKLFEDYMSSYGVVWLNDHQFVYVSAQVNEVTKKHILFLYDISTKTKTDMHLDGYSPGALSLDGKLLILAGNNKTILYNVHDGSVEVIANRRIPIEKAIWLPDGKGFLHSDATIEEILDALIFVDAHYGLYYYSLEKKRSVRLRKFYNLTKEGGFVVSSDIKVKLPDTEVNRKIAAGEQEDPNVIKICKLW